MKIALIGGGVVGRCYGAALQQQGRVICGIWDSRPTDAILAFAESVDSVVHNDAGEWLRDADFVLSAVFGTAALEVANLALPHVQPGTLYVDLTTADPADMRTIANIARSRGCSFVDAAITGAVDLHRERTPLLCAGERAAEVAALFAGFGARAQVVSTRPGDAACLKLLRSIFTKGLEALTVECLTTAERYGLREELHEVLSDVDQGSLRKQMESMLTTHIAHAARRRDEVENACRQMEHAGIDSIVLPAVAHLFDRAAVQAAFEAVGGSDACLHMARDYAMERQIFGRALSSFQAIKHKLADLAVAIEMGRSNAYYAGWAAGSAPEELPAAAAAARLTGLTAFEMGARENLQVHGGIGYTFEANCHFYYRRERMLAVHLGNRGFWADRLLNAQPGSQGKAA